MAAYHFSVDDVFDALMDGPANAVHPLLTLADELHGAFGTDVDMYVFAEKNCNGRKRSLDEVSSEKAAWVRARPWIRFGPHAFDPETPPYAQTVAEQAKAIDRIYAQIDRFAGPGQYSRWVRLHYFSECWEIAPQLRMRGVDALLTTDRPAVSYRLPSPVRETLRRNGIAEFAGLAFIRSHFRIEDIVTENLDGGHLDAVLRQALTASTPVIFTHEYELMHSSIRQATKRVISWIEEKHVSS